MILKTRLAASLLAILLIGPQATQWLRGQSPRVKTCDFSEYHPFSVEMIPSGSATRIVKPDYPKRARRMRIEGHVTVMVLIDKRGRVLKACMTYGNPVFRSNSMRAALRWRFDPNVFRSGPEMSGYFQLPIVFRFAPKGKLVKVQNSIWT